MMDTPFELVVTWRRLRSLFIGVTGFVVMVPAVRSNAEFDPPRIVNVVNPSDRGSFLEALGTRKLYSIDKGRESNITNGDTLNVYREKRISSLVKHKARILIGTLTIIDTQKGSAMGIFEPNKIAGRSHAVRHKFAMKGDFVIPRLVLVSNVVFEAAKADSELTIEERTDSDGDDAYNKRLPQKMSKNPSGDWYPPIAF